MKTGLNNGINLLKPNPLVDLSCVTLFLNREVAFMDCKKRFLITTADERSWKFDRPSIFLGEWCLNYPRKDIWSKMDAIVAAPYGLSEDERHRDFLLVEKIKSDLLVLLKDALNKHHKTERSIRYWRILLGHWLDRYVAVIVNRWSTLGQLFEKHAVSETVIFELADYSLATHDSYSFCFAVNDDLWNHVLYSKLLNSINSDGFDREFRQIDAGSCFLAPCVDNTAEINLKSKIKGGVRNVLGKIYRNSDAFVINSYLPPAVNVKLQLGLGQIPQFWSGQSISYPEPDMALRKSLRFGAENHSGLEKAVYSLLFDCLPSCFLEGYEALTNESAHLAWPTKPKFIFTSNSFDTDEPFKAWTGDKVEHGVPYYIGQHGNNYGTLKHCPCEVECCEIADKFITWGWEKENSKCAPAFIFKSIDRKKTI